MTSDKRIYQYNDNLLFEVIDPMLGSWEDNEDERAVEFICPEHLIRLTDIGPPKHKTVGYKLECPVCQKDKDYSPVCCSNETLDNLKKKALALYDKDLYKDAKLVRLDDFYVPEIKRFDALPTSTNYSIKADVKTDKDDCTVVVLYVGYKGQKEKSQIFIKPEKLQLSSDHKDLDPAKVLTKIELTLRDRNITQEYGDKGSDR
ncbi:hypothetical protein KA531_03470 [Candidatus Saccharibacteria bacterium]|nr:hypothetical protein [Candidatus Saccharibacteria bacterium]